MMPEITLNGSPDDLGWLRAVMLFPNDEQLRKQCFAVEIARFHALNASESAKLQIDVETLRLLLEAPAYGSLKETVSAITKRAIVAGDLLMTLYIMHKFGLKEPSVNKAIFVCQQFAHKAKYGDGTPMNVSERTVKECWREFKSVAHFWAAFRLNKAYPFAPSDTEVFAHPKFLGVASAVYQFGVTFVPYRAWAGKPVLDPKTSWRLPENIAPINLVSDQPPDRLLKYLKKYKAPKS
ncbi:MAG: hypothetical protein HXY27_04635 [Hydrogenophilaceae bacterium]|nr:hypothetical protein [Hydrogenophilaceae bacterium]